MRRIGLASLVTLLMLASVAVFTASPVVAAEVTFQDDFSNPTRGWASLSTPDYYANYGHGGFLLYIRAANTSLHSTAPIKETITDARVEADVIKGAGPDDAAFGVTCRVQDFDNFYYFNISAGGRYELVKAVKGEFHRLYMEKAQPSSAIKQGNTTNRLRLDCVGNRLTGYINGMQVITVTDDQFSSGDVGIKAEAFDNGDINVRFDNFSLNK